MLGNPAILSNDLLFQNIVSGILCKKSCRFDKRLNLARYHSKIDLYVSPDCIARNGHELSSTQIFMVNSSLEMLFKRDLKVYFNVSRLPYRSDSAAGIIRYFQRDFGLTEDDISFDTLIKIYKREIKNNYGANVPIYQQFNVKL
jgi:hypothetical protein